MLWIIAFLLTIAGALAAPKVSLRFLALLQFLYTIEWSVLQLVPPTVPTLLGVPVPLAVGAAVVIGFVAMSAAGAATLATGHESARYFILPVFGYFLLASVVNLLRPVGGSYFGLGPSDDTILSALVLFAFFEGTVLYRVAGMHELGQSSSSSERAA